MSNFDVKVVLLGDKACGKSSLLQRFVTGRWRPRCEPTFGCGFGARRLALPDGSSVSVGVWDTGGRPSFGHLSRLYVRGADAAICCFDQTSRLSFEAAVAWAQLARRLQPGIQLYIAATKTDRVALEEVTEEQRQAQEQQQQQQQQQQNKKRAGLTAAAAPQPAPLDVQLAPLAPDAAGPEQPEQPATPLDCRSPFAALAHVQPSFAASTHSSDGGAEGGASGSRPSSSGCGECSRPASPSDVSSGEGRPSLNMHASRQVSFAANALGQSSQDEEPHAPQPPAPPPAVPLVAVQREARAVRAQLFQVSSLSGMAVQSLFRTVAADVTEHQAAAHPGSKPSTPRTPQAHQLPPKSPLPRQGGLLPDPLPPGPPGREQKLRRSSRDGSGGTHEWAFSSSELLASSARPAPTQQQQAGQADEQQLNACKLS